MKKILVFMLLAVMIISCSSKKNLSVRKIYNNGVINNIASQYDFSQKRYSTTNNSKNNSVKNLSEVEVSIPTVKNNQNLLASKDKVVTSVLVNNYSHKKLPQINLNKRIIESFKKKSPIINNKKTLLKKPNTKDKIKKIFKIIVTLILITLTALICLLTGVVIAWDGITGFSFILLLASALFLFFSYRAVLKIIKTYSKKNKDDYRDSVD